MDPELDTIRCNALVYECQLGFHKTEQTKSQKIKVDLEASLLPHQGLGDDIKAIQLDYFKANQLITEFLEEKRYNLLEAVTGDIATLILKNFEVKQVKVSVTKFPFTMPNMDSVTYTCVRKRP